MLLRLAALAVYPAQALLHGWEQAPYSKTSTIAPMSHVADITAPLCSREELLR